MSHLLVMAVFIAGLLLLTKFVFDWLEYRNRKRQALDMVSGYAQCMFPLRPLRTPASTMLLATRHRKLRAEAAAQGCAEIGCLFTLPL